MVTGRFSKSSKTQLLTLPYIKSPWQLASHAIGPEFKSRSRRMSFWWKIYLQVCYDFPVTTNIVRNHATFHLTYLEVTLAVASSSDLRDVIEEINFLKLQNFVNKLLACTMFGIVRGKERLLILKYFSIQASIWSEKIPIQKFNMMCGFWGWRLMWHKMFQFNFHVILKFSNKICPCLVLLV